MVFKRLLNKHLIEWKNSDNRKPLILRGARQVGKTTLVKSFAKEYAYSLFLNLELKKDLRYFIEFSEVTELVESLFISHNIPYSEKKNTLLFIDEIQESAEAIALLRYFYELEPDLHVIAAGSLLEHALKNVKSFPVGRVEMLHLFPLNFQEYLSAIGEENLVEELHKVPIRGIAHRSLMTHFHHYAILGGMPEVIQKYLKNKSIAETIPVYESIWQTYKNDVVKYANNSSDSRVIQHIMNSAHFYVDERIKFNNFGQSNYRSREVGEAFRNLDDARIIQLIYPTTDVEPPLRSDLKKAPRLQFLDTGLINNELKIQSEMLGMDDLSNAYRGAIIPHLIAQELISLHALKMNKPNFWVREKKQASAEVDLVVPFRNLAIPVEIKSGKIGKLKSLHQFIEASHHPYAVRMYGGKFSIEEHQTTSGKTYFLLNLPYYLGTKLPEYIAFFVGKMKMG